MASMYAVYHGPEGLRAIANRIRRQTLRLAAALRAARLTVHAGSLFDTLRVTPSAAARKDILARAEARRINLRVYDGGDLGVSLDETVGETDLSDLVRVFGADPSDLEPPVDETLPCRIAARARSSSIPSSTRTVGNRDGPLPETARIADLSLTTSMIPLGSCTMKLNAAAEMFPISYPGFANFAPVRAGGPGGRIRGRSRRRSKGSRRDHRLRRRIAHAECRLAGEYAGLLVIRAITALAATNGATSA
jgi:glycine dehydrogenase